MIAQLLPEDRLKFVQEYKDRIPGISVAGIKEDIIANSARIDVKGILTEYQDVIPKETLVDIINALPLEDRVTLVRACNLTKDQVDSIVAFSEKNGDNVNVFRRAQLLLELRGGFQQNEVVDNSVPNKTRPKRRNRRRDE